MKLFNHTYNLHIGEKKMIEAKEKLISKLTWKETKKYKNRHITKYWFVRKVSNIFGFLMAILFGTLILGYSYIYIMMPEDVISSIPVWYKAGPVLVMLIGMILLVILWSYENLCMKRAEDIIIHRIIRSMPVYEDYNKHQLNIMIR